MVPGAADAGYALQFSNTNAANWGGLLMLYFPGTSATSSCLDASAYTGVEFSIKGSVPSGKFGVGLNMLDTMASTDGGLCDSASGERLRERDASSSARRGPRDMDAGARSVERAHSRRRR